MNLIIVNLDEIKFLPTQKLTFLEACLWPFQSHLGPFASHLRLFGSLSGPFDINLGPFSSHLDPFWNHLDHFWVLWNIFEVKCWNLFVSRSRWLCNSLFSKSTCNAFRFCYQNNFEAKLKKKWNADKKYGKHFMSPVSSYV